MAGAVLAGRNFAAVAEEYGTPVWVYDAEAIRAQIDRLRAFDVIRYAQKANSNLHVLHLMRGEGVLVDAVSLGELERAISAGYQPPEVIFTADLLDRSALARVVELGVAVNAGSPQMLEQIGRCSPGHSVWLRINPGFGHGHSRKTNTGGEHSKHGIWHEHLAESLALIDRYRLDLVGMHMHIGSGVDYAHLESVCEAMFKQVCVAGRDVRAISAGGGLSVPYTEGGAEVDVDRYFRLWDVARRALESHLGHRVELEIEPGRFLVAQAGALISEVRAQKPVGDNYFVLVDAGFNDLMRPAMYGSTHRISLYSPEGSERTGERRDSIFAGPLCESGDVFTQTENAEVLAVPVPQAQVGDLAVFHDAGAYGASMSSNYNTRPLIAEVMIEDGATKLIRRRQRIDELLALELTE